MKQIIIILFLLFHFVESYAQVYDSTNHDVSSGLGVPQIVCEGDEFQVTYNSFAPNFYSIYPFDSYRKWPSPYECDIRNNYEDRLVDNNSLRWEVNGTYRKDPDYKNVIYVKPSSSGVIKIYWQTKLYYPANFCQPSRTIINSYSGTSRNIIVIPKAPPPIVTANKNTSEINEIVVLTGSGCPNSNSTQYPYICRFYRAINECDVPPEEAYVGGSYSTPSTLVTSLAYESKYYFKGKCTTDYCANSALSTTPAVIRGITKPIVPAPNCNQGEVDESGYFPSRSDYHNYKISQDVCDKSVDSDCTVQNVFNLLKSQEKLSVPQYNDFGDIYSKLGQIPKGFLAPKTKGLLNNIITISSVAVNFYQQITPVSHCQSTGVYSPSSYLFLGKITPFTCLTTSNNGYFWDPITQGVDYNSKTVTNYTRPGHALHPGKIMITVKEDNCKVFVQVIGMGNSAVYDCNTDIGNFLSTNVNLKAGLIAFPNMLNRLKDYYNSKSWK